MRTGKDTEDTNESNKLRRALNKYEHTPKRHAGQGSIKQRVKNNKKLH